MTEPTASLKWIWPFELLEQIGEGGMGIVYRARYVVNGRHIALKMLPADVNDKTALARFERELEVLKTLKHPNIVRCFGGTCENKRRFYAMELVEGGTLEEELQSKGRLPWEQVIQYARQMCSALECSHDKGVIHRDIKPANFLLTKEGTLKLADFGLASVEASRKITAAGKTAGTFLYMAPEQIRGREVTPQTDLYALGCVLYELITGRPPFTGDSPATILHQHCHAPAPRPTQIALDCPVELENIILSLLAKEAVRRPESAAAVSRMLATVSPKITVVPTRRETPKAVPNKTTDVVTPVSGPRIPTWVTVGLIVGLVFSVLLNVAQYSRRDHSQAAVSLWISAMNDENPEVRMMAADALGKLAPISESSVDALTRGFEDVDPDVREASFRAFANAGEVGKKHLPALSKASKTESDDNSRIAAHLALTAVREAESSSFPWGRILVAACLLVGVTAAVTFWLSLYRHEHPQHA